ncbi:hypothetical protein AVEN_215399-1 [Araneus ventricosus]|uniref:Uncharacterized protein n=1 Tax=Araneus ventricosus TaxID=182803 RepID=A0A4Y2GMK5_ARAVE|nr:hypothetical protein AVEN_215399-1 [Araneus ventricosus]
MEAPCKSHCPSLRSLRATAPAPTPPPAFKTGPRPTCVRKPEWVYIFWFSLLCESLAPPPPQSHFSFMTQHSKWIRNEGEKSKIFERTTPILIGFSY